MRSHILALIKTKKGYEDGDDDDDAREKIRKPKCNKEIESRESHGSRFAGFREGFDIAMAT